MEGTIKTGDIVIATRYDREEINRYDIMVFEPNDDENADYYIKRVIGLPGETITVLKGRVYADGVELDQQFVPERQTTVGDGVYVVPEGCYFMLGDNRNRSLDSRFWENKYVPLESMTAKACIAITPFKSVRSLGY